MLMGQSSEDNIDDLVKDRKVQDGVDKRTYCVSFDKIHQVLPRFEAKWPVEKGVKKLINDLEFWKLNQDKFKQRDFYRLQHIEFLHNTGLINDELYFQ